MTEIIVCMNPSCGNPIERPRRRQKFCSDDCRAVWHKEHNRLAGIPGIIKSVRPVTRGEVSMVVRFKVEERDRALAFNPGQQIKVGE